MYCYFGSTGSVSDKVANVLPIKIGTVGQGIPTTRRQHAAHHIHRTYNPASWNEDAELLREEGRLSIYPPDAGRCVDSVDFMLGGVVELAFKVATQSEGIL
jgi:hypothetical protein